MFTIQEKFEKNRFKKLLQDESESLDIFRSFRMIHFVNLQNMPKKH